MTAWYQESFGKDYLLVYAHRDFNKARTEVNRMMDWLELTDQAKILDLCCGMGRHSLALADSGYRMTGIDLSDALLEEARLADSRQRVRWIHGDMRQVPLNETFDAVVNLFTSFGYFEEDEENREVLTEMDRLLKPGGRFLIDFLNAEYVKAHLVPFSSREQDGVRIEESRSLEGGYVKKRIRLQDHGNTREYREQVKLYSRAELEGMLQTTQLQVDAVYGDYEKSEYLRLQSPRLILVGTKRY